MPLPCRATCLPRCLIIPGSILSDYCDLDYIDAPHRCSPADDDNLDPLITQVLPL